MELTIPPLMVVLAYLLGSVSFAVVVSRAMGLADPRSYGSGNPGATNVLRTGNRTAAILTLLGDGAKGWLAVFAARMLAGPLGVGEPAIAGVALAVFLGHLYPIFFRFQGGKGVATAAGVLLALSPLLGLATLGVWLAVAAVFRYSSLAALVGAVFAPLCHAYLFGPGPISVAVLATSALLVWRHRANIEKLLAGQESKIGQKKPVSNGGAAPASPKPRSSLRRGG